MKENTPQSILNLFFFRTEAEAICSCLIANNLKQQEKCNFFAFKQKPLNIAGKLSPIKTILLANNAKGYFARSLEIKHQIKQISGEIDSPSKIVIHLARMHNSTVNYYIAAIIKNHPNAEVVVHVFPHGLKSQKMILLGKKTLRKIKIKRFSRKPFGLSFYNKIYDQYGFLSPITEKVYIFPGFEEEVGKHHDNIETLPLGNRLGDDDKKIENKMLILGQKSIADQHMPAKYADMIPKKIIAFAKENNISQIDYLPHPRKKAIMELYDETFSIVQTNYSAELLAIDGSYKIVASFSSTGLVFSKLLLGKAPVRVVSIGTNLSRIQDELHNILELMKKIGVEIIEA